MPDKKSLEAGPSLERRRQRFFARERRDFEVLASGRLTERQRRQPYWRERELQRQNAAKVAMVLLTAGEELPAPLARLLAPPPAPPPPGSPSGLFSSCLADVSRRAAHGVPWGSPWHSRWPQPVQRE